MSGIDIHYENGKLLTVSWQRPFTLEDVTDVKPNITYNIRILNRTQNAETVIVVADEVVNTIYNANLSLIWCPKISIEIAAINRVGSSRVTSKALWSKGMIIYWYNVFYFIFFLNRNQHSKYECGSIIWHKKKCDNIFGK